MKKRNVIALSILGLVVIVLLALQTHLLRTVRGWVWQAFVASAAKIAGIGPLQVDNDVLSQIKKLQVENIRLQSEREDYERLREQLGSTSFNDTRKVDALVATRPIDDFRTEIMLNKGAQDGVTLHAPVVTQGSILIGYITDMTSHTAVCRLLFHPDTSLSAEVLGQDNSRGLLRGQSYTSLALTTIPRDATIKKEQAVVTVADEQTPQGLSIGTINQINNAKNEAYQEATLRVSYSPDDLRAVTVLVSP